MRDVYDFAKYYIKNGADSLPNTYDGNMKLQKLLVFADFASIVEYGEPLFNEDVLAFQNGCVVEKVRLRYKNDYNGFKRDSELFQPDFTGKEYDVLNTTLGIFGKVSARELSEVNHTFRFWAEAYHKGTDDTGFHDKKYSVVNMTGYSEDIERMKEIVKAYKDSLKDAVSTEVVNGITFYYDGLELTDDLLEELYKFSLSAEDNAYSIYLDEEGLVIY